MRARVVGTAMRPRLSVFRSVQHITAQLVNDAVGRTIVAATDREVGNVAAEANRRIIAARAVGKLLAERARAKGITAAVFDRGGYAYHGRVQAIAEGAREGGLEF